MAEAELFAAKRSYLGPQPDFAPRTCCSFRETHLKGETVRADSTQMGAEALETLLEAVHQSECKRALKQGHTARRSSGRAGSCTYSYL
jgi:hypothetical protein